MMCQSQTMLKRGEGGSPMNDALKWAFVLMFMLPPPFVLPVFVEDNRESAFVSASLSLSTVLSLAAFAVIAVLV